MYNMINHRMEKPQRNHGNPLVKSYVNKNTTTYNYNVQIYNINSVFIYLCSNENERFFRAFQCA